MVTMGAGLLSVLAVVWRSLHVAACLPLLSLQWSSMSLPPLHHAAERGDLQEVRRLVEEEGLDPHGENQAHYNWTPLHYASEYVRVICWFAIADPAHLVVMHCDRLSSKWLHSILHGEQMITWQYGHETCCPALNSTGMRLGCMGSRDSKQCMGRDSTRCSFLSDAGPWLKFLKASLYYPWVTMFWLDLLNNE